MNHRTVELTRELLDSTTQDNLKLSACWNSFGLYHQTQYVIRLSYSVHNLVESAVKKKGEDITWAEFQAFSTYLHETVHWWQFKGSTIGFIMSMCFPAQAHSNLESLQHLAKSKSAKKPLFDWAEAEMLQGRNHHTPDIAFANRAVNNTLDIEFYRSLILDRSRLKELAPEHYFNSVAHSFYVAYDVSINTLRAVFDPEAKFLPNPDTWRRGLEEQEQKGKIGHFYGSPIPIYSIKGLDIIEGQARFIQLQFLSSASKNKITIQQVKEDGYLKGEYGDAFRFFLESTNSKEPEFIDSPLVGLFLLLCDISLNPIEGFPKTIANIEKFPESIDCSYRFIFLCAAVKENPQVKDHIKDYSKKEYFETAQILTSHCNYEHPYEIPSLIKKWENDHISIKELLNQQKDFSYKEDNIVLKVLFSHFLAFNIDKYQAPEFFCWAGMHLNFENKDLNAEELWLKNLSLYSDSATDQTILPRMLPGKPEKNIVKTFNAFYAANILYSTSNQWVMEKGPFKYDFSWLNEQTEPEISESKTKELFEKLYSISPDKIPY
ncbi:hypothetical protein SAMN04490186_0530 [Pseudomonas grimontii]|uniref:Uncharacterized protein n=1 Tax=Pseudomonas grimontii TaxID=129847 RepID=A0A1H1AY57_9PSED|nr:hypothetical protein [Pseudomonas grimontii]TWR64645.1 hypothetical protein FIV39_18080 [Pseudomonas grimontii]SDQ44582.1 hypothetical protein SAMN04490186_0530 [Pseudomonas grimontii]